MSERLGTRDPRFHDPDWLARIYTQHGDMWIALELGCNRLSVRRQRERLGIQSAPPGRRRGANSHPHITLVAAGITPPAVAHTGPTTTQLLQRLQREAEPGGPAPTETLLTARIRAAHEARLNGDQDAYDDALLNIATAAALLHQHRQHLKAA